MLFQEKIGGEKVIFATGGLLGLVFNIRTHKLLSSSWVKMAPHLSLPQQATFPSPRKAAPPPAAGKPWRHLEKEERETSQPRTSHILTQHSPSLVGHPIKQKTGRRLLIQCSSFISPFQLLCASCRYLQVSLKAAHPTLQDLLSRRQGGRCSDLTYSSWAPTRLEPAQLASHCSQIPASGEVTFNVGFSCWQLRTQPCAI